MPDTRFPTYDSFRDFSFLDRLRQPSGDLQFQLGENSYYQLRGPNFDMANVNGWKFHISVAQQDVARAYDMLLEKIIQDPQLGKDFAVKAANPKQAAINGNPAEGQSGKMLVIYGMQTQDPEKMRGFIRDLEGDFARAGIQPGPEVKIDKPVPGSKYNAAYRNDGTAGGNLDRYVSSDSMTSYNPTNADDPYKNWDLRKPVVAEPAKIPGLDVARDPVTGLPKQLLTDQFLKFSQTDTPSGAKNYFVESVWGMQPKDSAALSQYLTDSGVKNRVMAYPEGHPMAGMGDFVQVHGSDIKRFNELHANEAQMLAATRAAPVAADVVAGHVPGNVPASDIHMRRPGGGMLMTGIVAMAAGGAVLLNGGSSAEAATLTGKTAVEGVVPGATTGFNGITDSKLGWLDRTLNAADTATGVTAAGALATAAITSPAALTGVGSAVPAGALLTAGAATIANLAVGLAADATHAAGLTERAGPLHGLADLAGSYLKALPQGTLEMPESTKKMFADARAAELAARSTDASFKGALLTNVEYREGLLDPKSKLYEQTTARLGKEFDKRLAAIRDSNDGELPGNLPKAVTDRTTYVNAGIDAAINSTKGVGDTVPVKGVLRADVQPDKTPAEKLPEKPPGQNDAGAQFIANAAAMTDPVQGTDDAKKPAQVAADLKVVETKLPDPKTPDAKATKVAAAAPA